MSLFGMMLAFMLLAGPLAGGALAAGDHGDAPAGQDMSTMNQSDQMSGHDMNNMDGMDMDGMSQDSPGGHDSANGGGHGGEPQDPNTPPNWPVIYGFGGFNLLVILAAALLKNKGVNGVN